MKDFFKGWSDWMVILFFTAVLVLTPLENSIQEDHPASSNQAVLLPRNFGVPQYHGHEENKKPVLVINRPTIVGTASVLTPNFFPRYTMSNPKYGLITSNVSLPSVITFGSVSS